MILFSDALALSLGKSLHFSSQSRGKKGLQSSMTVLLETLKLRAMHTRQPVLL